MDKITKEMCVTFRKDEEKSKVLVLFFLFLLVSLAVGFFIGNWIVTVCTAGILVLLGLFSLIKTQRTLRSINRKTLYLVEDTVVDLKKSLHAYRGACGYDYNFTFQNHGTYTVHKSFHPTVEIPLHKDKLIRHLDVDQKAIKSCNVGASFYLLMDTKKQKIIKCFSKYSFDLLESDFEFRDGKYYCKQ